MLLIVEKNYESYNATVINPRIFTWFQNDDLHNELRRFFPNITFEQRSAGVQNTFDINLCVYYVFKMIYLYLIDGADLQYNGLLNRLCPYGYNSIMLSLAELIFDVTKFYHDMYGNGQEYLSEYEIKEIKSLCFK